MITYSSAGCFEDSSTLARTLLRLLKWLYSLLTTCVQKLVESKQGHEALELTDRICSVLENLVSDHANCALVFIARQDEPGRFSDDIILTTTSFAYPFLSFTYPFPSFAYPFPSFAYPFPSFAYPFPSFAYPFPSFAYPFPSFAYPFPYFAYPFPSFAYPFPSFAYPFPDVAASMDLPHLSRYSAVRPTLHTLDPPLRLSKRVKWFLVSSLNECFF